MDAKNGRPLDEMTVNKLETTTRKPDFMAQMKEREVDEFKGYKWRNIYYNKAGKGFTDHEDIHESLIAAKAEANAMVNDPEFILGGSDLIWLDGSIMTHDEYHHTIQLPCKE